VGLLDDEELAAELAALVSQLQALLRISVSTSRSENAPPFGETSHVFAAWALAVAELATMLGKGPVHIEKRDLAVSVGEGRTEVLRHLGTFIPSVPEGSIHDALVRLRKRLQEDQMAALSPNPTRVSLPHGI
jgi:hypothetical protein